MEFRVNSKSFEKILSKIIPAVPSKSAVNEKIINFFFEIKDGKLIISGTDGEIALKSSLDIITDEMINAKILIPAKLLFDLVRSLNDTDIRFVLNDSFTSLKFDTGEYKINVSDAEAYPELPVVSKDQEFAMDSEILKKALQQTTFAISKETVRPSMQGTLFEFTPDGLRFVTTDGHRLVKYINTEIKKDTPSQYIVPERGVSVLEKLLGTGEVRFYFSHGYAAFIMDDIEFYSRLIMERFPSYDSVIPKENEILLKVNTNTLLSVAKRMYNFINDLKDHPQVKLSITKNNLEVSTNEISTGSSAKENIQCEFSGSELDIAFKTQYLIDVLSHLNSPEAIFKLHSPTKAAIIEPSDSAEGEELLMLLMPVRLNN